MNKLRAALGLIAAVLLLVIEWLVLVPVALIGRAAMWCRMVVSEVIRAIQLKNDELLNEKIR